MIGQRGGFALGVVVGLLVGLSLALGVALYITKAPVPFVNKVPQRTAEQDQAEQRQQELGPERAAGRQAAAAPPPAAWWHRRGGARPWQPGAAAAPAPLRPSPAAGRQRPASARPRPGRACSPVAHRPAAPARRRPLRVYFVQAGAYTRPTKPNSNAPSWPCWARRQDHRTRTERARRVPRAPGPVRRTPEADGLQAQAAGSRHRGAAGARRAPLSREGTRPPLIDSTPP
jgi:cell division protein FtsN